MDLTRFERIVIESNYWGRQRKKEITVLTEGIDCGNCKILNIGCGRSNLTQSHIEAKEIINIDVESFSNLDLVASASRLPFGSDEFDVIFFLRVLHHIDNFLEAMNEALRCVKPGGLILISEPHELAVKMMDRSGLTSHPKKIIKKKNVKEFVKKHGLTITKEAHKIFWFYYGYQIKV